MKEQYEEQFAQFQKDVAEHAVTVLRDDGVYRHIRARCGDSYTYGFDVITWPGYLCYSGDVGCFVFSRLPDMFEFFRGRRTAMVDRGYLAEKAVATDKHDGIRRFSEDMFRAAVKDDFDAFVSAHDLSEASAGELWALIEEDVFSYSDNLHDALNAVGCFRWAPDHLQAPRGYEVFPDFWEHRLEEYTPRFAWCCYAVPWAIEQYDALPCQNDEPAQAVGAVARSAEASTE